MPRRLTELQSPSRRRLLLASTGLGAGLMLGALPLPAVAQPSADAGFERFMRVSARLTGRDDLLEVPGRTRFDALSARFPGFDDGLEQLDAFMEEHGGEISGLQAALDQAGAAFAWIPRQIVSAWYLGVVGAVEQTEDAVAGLTPPSALEGTASVRAIAWEQALMFTPLAGVIPIPSYAFQGDWTVPPTTEQ